MADKLKVYVETSFVCYLTGDQTANAKISADQSKDDAIIREVRAVRHQIAQECGNDVRKISERADKAYAQFLARTRTCAA